MERINIHNYEAYLLDFSEGNLSDECQMELELFLIQHPELYVDLSELSLASLENEQIYFSNKHNLKKSESDLVSEDQFIGYIENQLSTDERLLVEKSCVANAALLKELTLYKNTILVDEKSIVFNQKQSLKRKPKIIWFNFSTTHFAAAASVLFLIGLFIFWSNTETTTNNSQLANNTIKETSTAKKSSVSNSKIDTKNIATKISNTNGNITSIAHSSVIVNSQLVLETNIIISKNKNTALAFKDTNSNLAINKSPIENTKKEILMAQHSPVVLKENKLSVVEVITENEDETIVLNSDKEKKGIWTTISKTLKNLNHVGVKSVNGEEQENKENTSYAITLGGINIKHKAGL